MSKQVVGLVYYPFADDQNAFHVYDQVGAFLGNVFCRPQDGRWFPVAANKPETARTFSTRSAAALWLIP